MPKSICMIVFPFDIAAYCSVAILVLIVVLMKVASEFNSMYRALAYDARHENSYKQLLYSDLSMRYRVGVMTVIHIAHAILGQRVSRALYIVLIFSI